MSKTKVEALNALCEKLGKTSNAGTTVEALKNIYNALSGETSNAELISTAIDDITTVAEKPVEVVWKQNTVSKEVTSVKIPSGVTSIGVYAFYKCSSLASITIPDSVTSIEFRAFANCSSLASITIPDSVTSIGDGAFEYCSSLANIYYKGTEEQWNAITKGFNWNSKMGSNVEGGTVITYNYTG